MKQKIKITILGALMASLLSCNDLEINDFQRVSDETQYRSEAFAMGITANVYYEALASVWWWGMFAQEVSGDALVMPVITSYSIHYTKLYEAGDILCCCIAAHELSAQFV